MVKTLFYACILLGIAGATPGQQPSTSPMPGTPDKVKGQSLANELPPLMEKFYGNIVMLTARQHRCKTPVVLHARITQKTKWERRQTPPRLLGHGSERWRVDACGRQVDYVINIWPVNDGSGRVMIGIENQTKSSKEKRRADVKRDPE